MTNSTPTPKPDQPKDPVDELLELVRPQLEAEPADPGDDWLPNLDASILEIHWGLRPSAKKTTGIRKLLEARGILLAARTAQLEADRGRAAE